MSKFFEFLSKNQENLIHSTMLKILKEIGFFVDNYEILKKLEEFGGIVDYDKKRVYFSPDFIEEFIENSEKINWEDIDFKVTYQTNIYCGLYLDPFDDEYKNLNVRIFKDYFKVANFLQIPYGGGYAIQLPEVPEEYFLPFYHYLCFKYLGRPCCSINNIKWAEMILGLCEEFASEKSISLQDVISSAPLHIHFVSPLKFTKEEAEIFLFFAKRNLKIGIGIMDVIGVTTPVTISGAVSMHLSQNIFSNIIYRCFFGDKNLNFSCVISPLDMRSTVQCYGRPEKEIANIIMAQMARRYQGNFWPHTGHSDAKYPGPEAGVQKILNSLPSLLASGKANICCGLLSIDEVYSPIQMVIDKEIVRILERIAKRVKVDEDSIGFEFIKEAIENKIDFIATEHTLKYFKDELWEPMVFSRDMFLNWKEKGKKREIDIAKEIVSQALKKELPVHITESLEERMIEIIKKNVGYKIDKI